MKCVKMEDMVRSILETGAYETADENRAAKRAKPGALTTLRFSLGISKVFPMCALCEPFGLLTIDKWARFCFSTVQCAERLGMKVSIDGCRDRLAYKGPVMYLCNHMSTVETILLPPILHAFGPFSYVAKASLAHLPFLEKAAARTRMVPIGRKSPREDLVNMLKIGVERINAGESFLIFPQGTRDSVFRRKVYSSIGAKLAEKARCPIVPVVVDTRCQPVREKGIFSKIFKDYGPVDTSKDIRCSFGPVIPAGKARDMHEAAFDWMASKLEEWNLPVER
ncbi:MAG: 1-acyl-sn-glycerol-3-phosphate acyltransferase [Kiritimatiellae bacterium]|nr:1-acyl-sn-glycerol-3-phosphate acyltransferase [Kiritimatiellia bacterium]